jgi:hypothetical protein
VSKIRRAALVLSPFLVCSSACFGRDEIRSNTEVRSILTEAARLIGQLEGLRDRMVVLMRLGLANWKSGDSTSAKINFDEALELADGFPPQRVFWPMLQRLIILPHERKLSSIKTQCVNRADQQTWLSSDKRRTAQGKRPAQLLLGRSEDSLTADSLLSNLHHSPSPLAHLKSGSKSKRFERRRSA